jgi:hypothetical protein
MMLVEERGYRRSTLRYLWEAVRGTERTWRGAVARRTRVVSPIRSAMALCLGPLRYIQSVLVDTQN